ncbi:2-octaprenyl-6-methoxyphenyl hydroxylase [Chromobacterium sinusclupearum]|uniref:2-octaprenyl-6-methoxyphenyl hydroxylase n=1 Tax=Chromobacterium sinusclupearum TaxID=2077146 RepID=A0A2K4MI02_9NEIS|nr:FAD-dependent oxidoreductase [Chromobacterium sinusclupearum]POA96688.1 2-octaprenyl-6-methoxyphenyl hydroxylase [Chromobacterium sinusclupearum]
MNAMNSEHADVLVVGGGPVGALAALRLARQGRRVLLIEARAREAEVRDARALALSWHSRELLADAGAWPDDMPSTVIDTVHVSQQGSCGRTRLDKSDLGLPHLGAVVDYPALVAGLSRALARAGVQVLWQTRVTSVKSLSQYACVEVETPQGKRLLTARLVALAEGGALAEALPGIHRRTHDYHQCAVLAEVETERPPMGVAYERFAHDGPFALLPHGERYMLVWTRSQDDAERLVAADESALRESLQQAFGERQGRILSIGPRASFPLALRQANQVVSGRVALIGNAAQTMHPVAAQGLNLGLRDAVGLCQALEGAGDPGDARALKRYAAARRLDSHAVVGFTHGLIKLFDGHHPLQNALRGIGMTTLDALPALRRKFAGHLVFGVQG